MEKTPNILEEWALLLFLAISLGFLLIDQFETNPLRGLDFTPVAHDIAPYATVVKSWRRDNQSRLSRGNKLFRGEVFGPESIAFDGHGNGPYTGLADGRIVRWMGEQIGWETFAIVTESWSEKKCLKGVESTTPKQWADEKTCGRPLGLRFEKKSGKLFVADAYYGLMEVSSEGGLAKSLSARVGADPILFANDLDVHSNGSIFFTDSSKRYNRVDHLFILLEGESTGRILRYDPETRTTHVVIEGLAFPNGLQISKDERFLLFTETTNCRVMKYWLEGEKAGKVEIHANLLGFPDNVRRNEKGQFWVAIGCCRSLGQEILSRNPWIRSLYFRLPLKMSFLGSMVTSRMYTVACLIDENGDILEIFEDFHGQVMGHMSEVTEVRGKLWIGTVAHNYMATLDYSNLAL